MNQEQSQQISLSNALLKPGLPSLYQPTAQHEPSSFRTVQSQTPQNHLNYMSQINPQTQSLFCGHTRGTEELVREREDSFRPSDQGFHGSQNAPLYRNGADLKPIPQNPYQPEESSSKLSTDFIVPSRESKRLEIKPPNATEPSVSPTSVTIQPKKENPQGLEAKRNSSSSGSSRKNPSVVPSASLTSPTPGCELKESQGEAMNASTTVNNAAESPIADTYIRTRKLRKIIQQERKFFHTVYRRDHKADVADDSPEAKLHMCIVDETRKKFLTSRRNDGKPEAGDDDARCEFWKTWFHLRRDLEDTRWTVMERLRKEGKKKQQQGR